MVNCEALLPHAKDCANCKGEIAINVSNTKQVKTRTSLDLILATVSVKELQKSPRSLTVLHRHFEVLFPRAIDFHLLSLLCSSLLAHPRSVANRP